MPSRRRRSWIPLLATLVLASACRDAVRVAPPVLSIASGNGQSGFVRTALHAHLVVQLSDGKGRPLPAVRITWSPAGGARDSILPFDSVTNAAGIASARWLLDSAPGQHTLAVTASGGATVQAVAFANVRPPSSIAELPLETYEGSGEAVHPDFVRLPAAWSGDPFRLVATPYPAGNQNFENPSIFTGSTGTSWAIPASIRNPLETTKAGYLSDPDVLFDPDANEIRIYYRRVEVQNEVWLIRSSDGVLWSAPLLVVHAPNHTVVSPSVVRRSSTDWLMWSVNAGAQGCGGPSTVVERRRSADGVSWSDPEPTILDEADGFAWHIDVEWIPTRGEFWAIYPIKQSGSCVTDRLRLATSTDGVTWKTFPSPVLVKGVTDQLSDIVYRSSIDYDATTGIVSLWYSGAASVSGSDTYSWHLAWERMTLPALLARVNTPLSAAARMEQSAISPPLTNETAP